MENQPVEHAQNTSSNDFKPIVRLQRDLIEKTRNVAAVQKQLGHQNAAYPFGLAHEITYGELRFQNTIPR